MVPAGYRQHVLSVAHESQWSGHLGITKMYQLILKYFFLPGLKAEVIKYCHCCHVCQISGKPNQTIPAPLHPILAIGEPFERIIINCAGPLPRTKSGNQYLLTIMCAATRFPEAVPVHTITVKSVVKALTKFYLYLRPSSCNPNGSRHKLLVQAFQAGPQKVKRLSHSFQCIPGLND